MPTTRTTSFISTTTSSPAGAEPRAGGGNSMARAAASREDRHRGSVLHAKADTVGDLVLLRPVDVHLMAILASREQSHPERGGLTRCGHRKRRGGSCPFRALFVQICRAGWSAGHVM